MKRSRHDEDQAITAAPGQAAAPAAFASTEAAPAEAPASVLPPLPSSLAHATLWYYDDVQLVRQGPFSSLDMRTWYSAGCLPTSTCVAPSWYGEVPVDLWPISTLWEEPESQAFALADDAQVVVIQEPPKPEFIPAENFVGAREGYVFGTDYGTALGYGFGTGYYLDVPKKVEVTYESLHREIDEKKAKFSNFHSSIRPPSSPTRR